MINTGWTRIGNLRTGTRSIMPILEISEIMKVVVTVKGSGERGERTPRRVVRSTTRRA